MSVRLAVDASRILSRFSRKVWDYNGLIINSKGQSSFFLRKEDSLALFGAIWSVSFSHFGPVVAYREGR